ncbi:hypothetical protein FPV67DRAFT_1448510 [Lyophyllum atratum]|nr:hypothetical protein FPV67DRAFT_1448510 [Lyophyllum atratum]
MPGYEAKLARSSKSDEGEDEEETDDSDNLDDDDEDTTCPQDQTIYNVAKKPVLLQVTIPSIAQDFGAQDFLTHLNMFLRERSITGFIPSSPTFPVYNRLHLTLPPIPEVSTTPIKGVIVSTKSEHGYVTTQGIRKAKPARFSTILVCVPAGNHSKSPVDGLRVVQVHLIFRLSEDSSLFREPLLYHPESLPPATSYPASVARSIQLGSPLGFQSLVWSGFWPILGATATWTSRKIYEGFATGDRTVHDRFLSLASSCRTGWDRLGLNRVETGRN